MKANCLNQNEPGIYMSPKKILQFEEEPVS